MNAHYSNKVRKSHHINIDSSYPIKPWLLDCFLFNYIMQISLKIVKHLIQNPDFKICDKIV